jgi:hypothetical protein
MQTGHHQWWKKGSKMKHGEGKAGQRLSDLGCSAAGSKRKANIWLYYKQK